MQIRKGTVLPSGDIPNSNHLVQSTSCNAIHWAWQMAFNKMFWWIRLSPWRQKLKMGSHKWLFYLFSMLYMSIICFSCPVEWKCYFSPMAKCIFGSSFVSLLITVCLAISGYSYSERAAVANFCCKSGPLKSWKSTPNLQEARRMSKIHCLPEDSLQVMITWWPEHVTNRCAWTSSGV